MYKIEVITNKKMNMKIILIYINSVLFFRTFILTCKLCIFVSFKKDSNENIFSSIITYCFITFFLNINSSKNKLTFFFVKSYSVLKFQTEKFIIQFYNFLLASCSS